MYVCKGGAVASEIKRTSSIADTSTTHSALMPPPPKKKGGRDPITNKSPWTKEVSVMCHVYIYICVCVCVYIYIYVCIYIYTIYMIHMKKTKILSLIRVPGPRK